MDMKHHIGLRAKSARLKRGMTQEQLAEQVEKSTETISNLERGFYMTGLETLQRIGQCLDVPMTYFFKGAEKASRIDKPRFALELEFSRLGEELPDDDLRLSIRLVKAVTDREQR
jgi:transcriptional regulator with XRE-family HTH domain